MPYRLDEGFKSSSYLTETLLDPELGHAYESNKTAFNKAHNVKENMWAWLERPDNRFRLTRLGAGMDDVKNASPANSILEGFCDAVLHSLHTNDTNILLLNSVGYSWERLPEGSLVVDVGGGVGSQSLLLANHHPQLHFVVQDRESVVGDAIEVCALI